MKISLRWLNDHVDLSGFSADEVAEQLTMKTALIEGIERQGRGLEDVRVGLVEECSRHPEADRLSVCVVDTGKGRTSVVCGAPNVASGQKIAFAPAGSVLPQGLKLEARKIRGVLSQGMILSEKELGLSEEHEGILVLAPDAPLGARLADLLGLDDVVYEIDNKAITHRGDLWGHRGFARELAAIFGRPMKPLPTFAPPKGTSSDCSIRLDAKDGCPRYLGLLIDDVSAEIESPPWMQRRLHSVGMRPIQLLVDLSNYVMLELGQPTHPFDRDLLAKGIVVRRALAGEKLKTLDGVERTLIADDLLIADEERAVAIAGIIGGEATEIHAGTRRVLLESAVFDSISLRRTSARQGLRSEALARFEKFLDPTLPELALERYAWLLKEHGKGARIGKVVAAGSVSVLPTRIRLRPERARRKLGYPLSTNEMVKLLSSVEFKVTTADGRSTPSGEDSPLEVEVPIFRAGRDVTHEDDLIEEVGRLAGYERVPALLPRLPCDPPREDALRQLSREVVRTLVHECAYTETTNYSFATDVQVQKSASADESFLMLANPVTADAPRLRRSLVPGLLEFVESNLLRREEVRLFEIGRAYLPEGMDRGSIEDRELPRERRLLCAVRASRSAKPEDLVLKMRGDLEVLFRRLRLPARGRTPKAPERFAHPSMSIEWVLGEQAAGQLAALHPSIAHAFDLEANVAVAEIDLEELCRHPREPVRMKAIAQFPSVYRDLAIEAREEILVAHVLGIAEEAGRPFLSSMELFDVFRSEKIAKDHRSLCFHLEYRVDDRTLTDSEVEKVHGRIVERLEREGMKLRI